VFLVGSNLAVVIDLDRDLRRMFIIVVTTIILDNKIGSLDIDNFNVENVFESAKRIKPK
jgi:hypothetical protein